VAPPLPALVSVSADPERLIATIADWNASSECCAQRNFTRSMTSNCFTTDSHELRPHVWPPELSNLGVLQNFVGSPAEPSSLQNIGRTS
jgi:hypothetical protein